LPVSRVPGRRAEDEAELRKVVRENGAVAETFRGTIHRLSFPFSVCPSGGDLAVFGREERHNAYAVICGYSPGLEAAEREECVALITVRGVTQYIVGYPNEEAYWRDPRGEIDHGCCEVVGSDWQESIDAYNTASFGRGYRWRSAEKPKRHFFVGSKDSSAQFLADSIDLDVFTGSTLSAAYGDARREALRRLDTYPEP
jgi:hypothetical protein